MHRPGWPCPWIFASLVVSLRASTTETVPVAALSRSGVSLPPGLSHCTLSPSPRSDQNASVAVNGGAVCKSGIRIADWRHQARRGWMSGPRSIHWPIRRISIDFSRWPAVPLRFSVSAWPTHLCHVFRIEQHACEAYAPRTSLDVVSASGAGRGWTVWSKRKRGGRAVCAYGDQLSAGASQTSCSPVVERYASRRDYLQEGHWALDRLNETRACHRAREQLGHVRASLVCSPHFRRSVLRVVMLVLGACVCVVHVRRV